MKCKLFKLLSRLCILLATVSFGTAVYDMTSLLESITFGEFMDSYWFEYSLGFTLIFLGITIESTLCES